MDWGTWNLESFNVKPKSDYRNDGFVLKDKSFGPGDLVTFFLAPLCC